MRKNENGKLQQQIYAVKANEKLIALAGVLCLLLVFVGGYFKFFPTIINSNVTNFIIVASTFLLISLLVYGILLVKKPIDAYLILPLALIFIFIARAIPHLRLSYPPLHDPYYYLVTTLNIVEHGTLEPIMKWWYSQIDMQLHYPTLHLLTASLTKVTGIDPMLFARFLMPALSSLFFLGVYLVAKEITKNIRISLLAALFSSLIDVLIFYQSEYHPQGLAFIVFVFWLYAFMKFHKNHNLAHLLLLGIFMMLLLLTHHFTSIFVALILILYLVLLVVYNLAFKEKAKISTIIKIYKTDILVIGSYLALVLVYNLICYKGIMRIYYSMVAGSFAYSSTLVVASILFCVLVINSIVLIRRNKEFLRSLLTNRSVITVIITIATVSTLYLYYRNITSPLHSLVVYKVFLFMLAFIYIIRYGLWVRQINLTRSIMLFLSIILSGVLGFYFINIFPVDRVIAFSAPFACIFTSIILYRFINKEKINKILASRSSKTLLTTLIASVLFTTSFFNSQIPAFFFKDSKIDTSYWYSNKLPSMEEYKVAGEWLEKHTPSKTRYGVEFDTRTMLFFFGRRSMDTITYNPTTYSNDYIFVNPNTPYDYKGYIKPRFDQNLNVLYFNGELKIYGRPRL